MIEFTIRHKILHIEIKCYIRYYQILLLHKTSCIYVSLYYIYTMQLLLMDQFLIQMYSFSFLRLSFNPWGITGRNIEYDACTVYKQILLISYSISRYIDAFLRIPDDTHDIGLHSNCNYHRIFYQYSDLFL